MKRASIRSRLDVSKHGIFMKYLFLTIALIVSAMSYNLFLRPAHIVTGGTSGIAIITEFLFDIDSSIMIFILDVVFLIFSYFFLGKKETVAVLYITLFYPVLVSLFSFLNGVVLINNNNILLISIYAGVLSGVSSGLIYKAGLNTGGVGVLAKIMYKYKKISISKANFIMSLMVILVGSYVFGINMLLYAAVVIAITRVISENILLGVSNNKTIFIVSEKHAKIKEFLNSTLLHDATVFDVIGRYSSVNAKMIMVTIPSAEYFILKEAIFDIDKSAFVFASDSYEVKKQDVILKSKLQ